MEWYIQLIVIILPGILVFATIYILMKQFFENQDKLKMRELRKEGLKVVAPQQMQAYERLILLMDRLNPENLVMRVQQPGMNVRRFQGEILKTIRQEFEHNTAQQLYVSTEAWALIKRSKEETVRMVNLAAGKCNSDAEAMELSRLILNMTTQLDKVPTEVAIEGLKREFRSKYA